MSGPSDELVERILSAAASISRARVEQIITEATGEAEAEVKALLKSSIKASLLRDAAARLAGEDNAACTQPAIAPKPPAIQAPTEPMGRYVYCITSADAVVSVDDLAGIEGAKIEIIAHGPLQAMTSVISLAAFQPAALRQRFQDAQWVEQNVRAHDQVLRAASLWGAVVPFRFCTILRGREDVRRLMETHADRLVSLLASLDGKREWGVKFLLRPRLHEGSDAHKSGKSYLIAKRAAHAKHPLPLDAEKHAHEIHAKLQALANDSVLLPLQEHGAMLMNAAYLLDRDAEKSFDAALAAASETAESNGIHCEVTGPWPPYSFVKLDLPLSSPQAEETRPNENRARSK